jgi:hypothetical protein
MQLQRHGCGIHAVWLRREVVPQGWKGLLGAMHCSRHPYALPPRGAYALPPRGAYALRPRGAYALRPRGAGDARSRYMYRPPLTG